MGDTSPSLAKAPHPAVVAAAALLACLPLLALGQFLSHARTDEFDSWLFAYYGRELLGGRMLYRELWDNKPPGIFWLNALGLWLGRGSLWGVYALCAAAVLAATGLVFAAAKRLYGISAAAIAAVLAALYLNIYPYHVGCDRPSTFLVSTELAAFAFYVTALTAARGRWALLILAGFCGGLGPCLHQSALAMSAAVLLHSVYLMIRKELRWPAAAGRLLLYGLGAGLSIGATVYAIYRMSDPAWAWNAIVEFNRLYFKAEDGSRFVPRFFAIEEHLKVMGLALILALATLVQPVLRRLMGAAPEGESVRTFRRVTQPLPPRSETAGQTPGPDAPAAWPYAVTGGHTEGMVTLPDEDPIGKRPEGLLFLIWAWFLVAVYLALLGPHQRLQYYGVALPPLVMICAHAVYLLLRAGRRIPDVQPAYPVVVGVLWFGYMMVWPVQEQIRAATVAHYQRFEETPDARLVSLLDAVRRHTGPEDTIFVSGYGPKLYWDAERHSALRYIGTEKVGQLGAYGGDLKAEIVRLLIAAKPKAIVVDAEELKASVHPRITDFAEIQPWLESNYARPEDYDGSNLWVAVTTD